MADIAGAISAIEQLFADKWSQTRIAYVNTTPSDPWPPINPITGNPEPWVLIEVTETASDIRAVGEPGNQFWLSTGLIHVHVYVPLNYGREDVRSFASQAGEIFRNQTFYNETPGHEVRTLAPKIDGGDIGSDDGAWFRVTATISFEYYHRG